MLGMSTQVENAQSFHPSSVSKKTYNKLEMICVVVYRLHYTFRHLLNRSLLLNFTISLPLSTERQLKCIV